MDGHQSDKAELPDGILFMKKKINMLHKTWISHEASIEKVKSSELYQLVLIESAKPTNRIVISLKSAQILPHPKTLEKEHKGYYTFLLEIPDTSGPKRFELSTRDDKQRGLWTGYLSRTVKICNANTRSQPSVDLTNLMKDWRRLRVADGDKGQDYGDYPDSPRVFSDDDNGFPPPRNTNASLGGRPSSADSHSPIHNAMNMRMGTGSVSPPPTSRMVSSSSSRTPATSPFRNKTPSTASRAEAERRRLENQAPLKQRQPFAVSPLTSPKSPQNSIAQFPTEFLDSISAGDEEDAKQQAAVHLPTGFSDWESKYMEETARTPLDSVFISESLFDKSASTSPLSSPVSDKIKTARQLLTEWLRFIACEKSCIPDVMETIRKRRFCILSNPIKPTIQEIQTKQNHHQQQRRKKTLSSIVVEGGDGLIASAINHSPLSASVPSSPSSSLSEHKNDVSTTVIPVVTPYNGNSLLPELRFHDETIQNIQMRLNRGQAILFWFVGASIRWGTTAMWRYPTNVAATTRNFDTMHASSADPKVVSMKFKDWQKSVAELLDVKDEADNSTEEIVRDVESQRYTFLTSQMEPHSHVPFLCLFTLNTTKRLTRLMLGKDANANDDTDKDGLESDATKSSDPFDEFNHRGRDSPTDGIDEDDEDDGSLSSLAKNPISTGIVFLTFASSSKKKGTQDSKSITAKNRRIVIDWMITAHATPHTVNIDVSNKTQIPVYSELFRRCFDPSSTEQESQIQDEFKEADCVESTAPANGSSSIGHRSLTNTASNKTAVIGFLNKGAVFNSTDLARNITEVSDSGFGVIFEPVTTRQYVVNMYGSGVPQHDVLEGGMLSLALERWRSIATHIPEDLVHVSTAGFMELEHIRWNQFWGGVASESENMHRKPLLILYRLEKQPTLDTADTQHAFLMVEWIPETSKNSAEKYSRQAFELRQWMNTEHVTTERVHDFKVDVPVPSSSVSISDVKRTVMSQMSYKVMYHKVFGEFPLVNDLHTLTAVFVPSTRTYTLVSEPEPNMNAHRFRRMQYDLRAVPQAATPVLLSTKHRSNLSKMQQEDLFSKPLSDARKKRLHHLSLHMIDEAVEGNLKMDKLKAADREIRDNMRNRNSISVSKASDANSSLSSSSSSSSFVPASGTVSDSTDDEQDLEDPMETSKSDNASHEEVNCHPFKDAFEMLNCLKTVQWCCKVLSERETNRILKADITQTHIMDILKEQNTLAKEADKRVRFKQLCRLGAWDPIISAALSVYHT